MSTTINAFDHKAWDAAGLQDFGDFSDRIEYVNQQDFADVNEGEWFYIPEESLADGRRVIYFGSYGNYNSPGASTYTNAEIFDKDEEEEYAKTSSSWESKEEYIDNDDDLFFDDEDDDEDFDDDADDDDDDDDPAFPGRKFDDEWHEAMNRELGDYDYEDD